MHGKTLILGLGNTILGDDGVGISVARKIREGWPKNPDLDIEEASLAGAFLLDLIAGYQTLIITDAIITDDSVPAGSIHLLGMADLGEVGSAYAAHALDLRTTVELGRKLGYDMPEAIRIYAVEIKEHTVFRDGLSPEVEQAVLPVARKIMEDLGKEGDR